MTRYHGAAAAVHAHRDAHFYCGTRVDFGRIRERLKASRLSRVSRQVARLSCAARLQLLASCSWTAWIPASDHGSARMIQLIERRASRVRVVHWSRRRCALWGAGVCFQGRTPSADIADSAPRWPDSSRERVRPVSPHHALRSKSR